MYHYTTSSPSGITLRESPTPTGEQMRNAARSRTTYKCCGGTWCIRLQRATRGDWRVYCTFDIASRPRNTTADSNTTTPTTAAASGHRLSRLTSHGSLSQSVPVRLTRLSRWVIVCPRWSKTTCNNVWNYCCYYHSLPYTVHRLRPRIARASRQNIIIIDDGHGRLETI